MNRKLVTATSIAIIALAVPAMAFAGDNYDNEPYTGSAAFEQMKTLAGTWQGTSSSDMDSGPVTVQYKVSSGGSSVVETLFPGTSREMVSVYHDVNGRLTMTHFCMLGNQPRMSLGSATDNQIVFTFESGDNLDPDKDPHMHGLTLDLKDRRNHIVQNWTFYKEGNQQGVNAITLSRVE